MKSMQRKFGGLMKRSADQEDVGTVLTEFKTVNDMLDRLANDIREYRNSWDDTLKLQYDCSEAFASLYKPITFPGPTDPSIQRPEAAETPQSYIQKCLGLQKLYSDLKADLQQEVGMIDAKLVRPAEQARAALKGLQKTLKHRENMKLDYERYVSRAEHARKKELRSAKEEAALATHENNLAQAQIDYQTADEQVKQTFPPVTDAVLQLLPFLLTNMVMLQTTLIGQVYTVLDGYTKKFRFPNPPPGDAEIVDVWQREFEGFRGELEQGISVIAQGKAVGRPMQLPEETEGSTLTGLGLRNKAGGLVQKGRSSIQQSGSGGTGSSGGGGGGLGGMLHRPTLGNRSSSQHSSPQQALTYPTSQIADTEDEPAPAQPPRPSATPAIPQSSKPRPFPSSSLQTPDAPPPPYEPSNGTAPIPPYPTDTKRPPTSRTPSSTLSPAALALAQTSIAAKKKKPAPPVPAKRLPSSSSNPDNAHYVTALYDFDAQKEGDLGFREGERIKIVWRSGVVEDWWEGECGPGRRGVFPGNYVSG